MQKKTRLFFIGVLAILIITALFPSFVNSLPAGPIVTYLSNSTAPIISSNRSTDAKGTISVVTLASTQQDYSWKAYVGNVSGKLSLDDGSSYTIYDWSLGVPTGEVYVSRAASVSWADISCASQTMIDNEETAVSMSAVATDSINKTFANIIHRSFAVGTKVIANSTCRSIATYINDTAQTLSETAKFQEVLLGDSVSGRLVYTTLMENNEKGYNNGNYVYQLLVAENESATVPTTYYFYVELT